MKIILKKLTALTFGIGLIMQLAACGTILHPERKGQVSGRLDPSIVVLDAIGLLFFVVPGVIAFAVDFSNGTIYLPNSSAPLTGEEIKTVKMESDITNDDIERTVLKETGIEISVSSAEVHSSKSLMQLNPMQSGVRFL